MSVIDRDKSIFGLGMKLRQVGRVHIGRILGSVPNTSGAYKSLIDLLERCYFMRAEINALSKILLDKRIVTNEEFRRYIDDEMRHYFGEVAKDWPEIEFREDGFTIKDAKAFAERSAREGWPP